MTPKGVGGASPWLRGRPIFRKYVSGLGGVIVQVILNSRAPVFLIFCA